MAARSDDQEYIEASEILGPNCGRTLQLRVYNGTLQSYWVSADFQTTAWVNVPIVE
jgi:hypothetical protein